MGGLLGFLVLGPVALALLVLLLPAPHWRRAAVGGALLLAALSLAAARAAVRPDPDLRSSWEADDGLVSAALDRAGIREPGVRPALQASLSLSVPDERAARGLLEPAVGRPEAQAYARDVARLFPGDALRAAEATRALDEAGARVEELLRQRAALLAELAPLRRAVLAPRGQDLRLARWSPWLPALGLSWFLAVDALGGLLLLVVGLVGLAAAAGLPEGETGRAPAATCLALQGALAGVVATQDAALAWSFLLLLQLPGWLLLLGDDGPRRAAGAERWALVALGSVLPLGAALAAAASAAGATPAFALPALADGAVPARLQPALLVAAALLALPRLLPLPGALGLAAQLSRAPGPTRALLQAAWVGAGVWALLLLVPLAPGALPGARLGLAGLGLAALMAGAARALLEPPGSGLVAAMVQARAGLAALGLFAGNEVGLLGAGLSLLSLLASGGAAQLAAAGLERGGGDLAQLLVRRPVLARVAALALLLLAGLPGSGGFAGALLVLQGTREAGLLPCTLLGGLALLALACASLRAIGRAVGELRAGAPPRAGVDLTSPEALGLVPLLLLELVLGLAPRLLLDPFTPACARLAAALGAP